MRIVINTKMLPFNNTCIYRNYMQVMINKLVSRYKHFQFYIITEDENNFEITEAENCIVKIISLKSTNSIALSYWYNIKLATFIKKVKPSIVWHLDSRCIVGLKTPQIITIAHLSFLYQTNNLSNTARIMYSLYQKKWIQKASATITFSLFTQKAIFENYRINNKVEFISPVISSTYNPITYVEKEKIQQTLTGDEEYFLYFGSFNTQHYLVQLLKAFTLFKKRLQSSMKLVLIADAFSNTTILKEKLKTYKFKEDVLLIENASEELLQKITSAAYAFIYTYEHTSIAFNALQAMQAGVPIACSNTGCLAELFNNVALFFDTNNEKNIAEQMMMLYKDEGLRNNLIENGIKKAQEFNWDKSINETITIIEHYAMP